MDTLLIERSNRIEGTANSYTPAQLAHMKALRPGLMQFSGRALFTDPGYRTATEITGSQRSKLQVYIPLAHAWHPDADRSAWAFDEAMQDKVPNMIWAGASEDRDPHPVVRWVTKGNTDPVKWLYCADGYLNSSADWVDTIAGYVTRYPVGSLFIDYLDLGIYDVETGKAANVTAAQLRYYRSYQWNFMVRLRASLPGVEIMVNGKWPLVNEAFTKAGLVDTIFIEKCGGLWYTAEEMAAWAAGHTARYPAVNVCWDHSKTTSRFGMNAGTFARLMAATHGHMTADKIDLSEVASSGPEVSGGIGGSPKVAESG